MIRWLFAALPGPLPVRILVMAAFAAAAVALLFTVVFPWVDTWPALRQDGTL
ncbi:hypothetical protein [Arthrobacter sp. UM1]|uniref:hypothetical protein n=1 Tax=Arthrobacter sp. UM1 TaxID=2766776 RepID=UPI001CF63421|nr:hypothetical protein [Arthrobacter sp. UM1]MCB4209221.1 hypothetical protein [Arthrobacter sp. UM1]